MTRHTTYTGPFLTRLWYEDAEFESITAAALRRHGLFPDKPEPVNIELFVELQFGIPYRFEKLRKGLLGSMRFSEEGHCEIILNKGLDRPRFVTANRTCRDTLAHECGHGLLHDGLFAELWQHYRRCQKRGAEHLTTFEERMEDLHAGCREKKWWEYQANRAMSALLVPRELLLACVSNSILADTAPKHWTSAGRSLLADHVCRRFDVSRRLAANRIEGIFPAEKPKLLPVKLVEPLVSLRRLLPALPRPALVGLN